MTHKACSVACSIELAKSEREKTAARVAKVERQATRARIMALKPKSYWLKRAQAAFNAWIRYRDKDLPCICCGQPLAMRGYSRGGDYDCGHYRSTGSAKQLRFHEDNAAAQRKQCNRDGAGRAVDFRIGLIARIGLQRVESLETDSTIKRWTIQELQAIEVAYKTKLREAQRKDSNH